MRPKTIVLTMLVFFTIAAVANAEQAPYPLKVLPAEHRKMTDPQTGTELTFLTTDPAEDTNLYFHDCSWLADSSLIVFMSQRETGGLMGYLTATGELVQLTTPRGGLGGATAARNRNSVFALRGQEVVELALKIDLSADPKIVPSKVTATERVICEMPKDDPTSTALNESCDGKWLSVGVGSGDKPSGKGPGILLIDVATGKIKDLCRIASDPGYAGHVQWSRTNPNLLSFAGRTNRLYVIDIRDGIPRCVHRQVPNELVTHEHWWVNDQMTFCGGYHPKPTEDAHVKLLNITTGEVRIIGAGAWWPTATPAELAKWNWWHAAGDEQGRWVAADNWHGDIVLFDGKTTRMYQLALGHRTYGHGVHPHVGWDRRGEQVAFTSHMLGNPNVCVATIPSAWQAARDSE